jgi:hypothetical protein
MGRIGGACFDLGQGGEAQSTAPEPRGRKRSARITPKACLRHDGGGSGAAKSEIWRKDAYVENGNI